MWLQSSVGRLPDCFEPAQFCMSKSNHCWGCCVISLNEDIYYISGQQLRTPGLLTLRINRKWGKGIGILSLRIVTKIVQPQDVARGLGVEGQGWKGWQYQHDIMLEHLPSFASEHWFHFQRVLFDSTCPHDDKPKSLTQNSTLGLLLLDSFSNTTLSHLLWPLSRWTLASYVRPRWTMGKTRRQSL